MIKVRVMYAKVIYADVISYSIIVENVCVKQVNFSQTTNPKTVSRCYEQSELKDLTENGFNILNLHKNKMLLGSHSQRSHDEYEAMNKKIEDMSKLIHFLLLNVNIPNRYVRGHEKRIN